MAISSNTLFHFTRKFEFLLSILNGEFHPRYSLECVKSVHRTSKHVRGIKTAYPMICFCDIPLSNVKNHIEFYGNYGIGLKKEWGKKVGLNPIIYLEENSILADHIVDLGDEVFKYELKNRTEFKRLKRKYHEVARYTKPYSGENYDRNNGKIIQEYNFYDEKEWRFVPPGHIDKEQEYFYIKEKEFKDKDYLKDLNKTMEGKGLKFKPADISYIIVKEDHEIGKIIDFIENSDFPAKSTKKLISRIQTKKQILHDF